MRTGSHVNAQFKGRQDESSPGSRSGDRLPLTSMAAKRAARRIVEACRYGEPALTLTWQAKTAIGRQRGGAQPRRQMPGAGGRLLPGPAGEEGPGARPAGRAPPAGPPRCSPGSRMRRRWRTTSCGGRRWRYGSKTGGKGRGAAPKGRNLNSLGFQRFQPRGPAHPTTPNPKGSNPPQRRVPPLQGSGIFASPGPGLKPQATQISPLRGSPCPSKAIPFAASSRNQESTPWTTPKSPTSSRRSPTSSRSRAPIRSASAPTATPTRTVETPDDAAAQVGRGERGRSPICPGSARRWRTTSRRWSRPARSASATSCWPRCRAR